MKIKFFKIKKDYRKENFEINSDVYWKILVIFFTLTIFTSFIFAYNIFIQTNKDDVPVFENNNDKIGNKEKENMKDVLEYFSNREKKSEEIMNSSVSVVDPSL